MQETIVVKEDTLSVAVEVNSTIHEFGEPFNIEYFESRINRKQSLVLVAYVNDKPAGYMVSYNRDSDGSFYCWMAGVSPDFRRMGVVGRLMGELEQWTSANGYSWVTVKTRNQRREMLAFLVKVGFNFTGVEERPATKDNRVLLEKRISKIAG